ncbi:MAG TPA: pyridoxal-phosphate dependent enzyme [Bacteroidales bacterium]
MLQKTPDRTAILEAHERIRPYILRTPILTSETFNKQFKTELFFKCENFQKVGAFKSRGAVNAVFSIDIEKVKNGVATHSSGNHAQALARAAKLKGVPAYIVMPDNAPQVKIDAVKEYGGQITFCQPNLQSREETLKVVVAKTGAVEIHPYNNYTIIAGAATATVELLEETAKLDLILCPVGGGGLLSGTALSSHYFSETTKVIACEPAKADDAFRSFQSGKIIPSVNPQTIADGLLTSLGEKNFPIIQQFVSEIVTVSEESIVQAMWLIFERMKIVVEPSAAVPFAAILEGKVQVENKRVGIIVSGGNVDLKKLPF